MIIASLEHLIGILISLFRLTCSFSSDDPDKDEVREAKKIAKERLISKFIEKDFEKCDHLIEMIEKYNHKVLLAADKIVITTPASN